MSILFGIDLGTSCVKIEALDVDTKKQAIARNFYQIQIPEIGQAEQNPGDWWQATVDGIRQVAAELPGYQEDAVKGIGFSGQMHGMVLLDKNQELIRPAIIWCDQRSQKQVQSILSTIGEAAFKQITLNPLNTGFLLASLLWVKENEPENYSRIDKVMLPKDYLRFKLTGKIGTDFSDASASLALDVQRGAWSEQILQAIGLDINHFPPIESSFTVAGTLTAAAADETGLPLSTVVAFGGGDQMMQALGNGLVKPGFASATIGTGGQIFTPIASPVYDPQFRLHTFCNSFDKSWCLMGASLSAGLSLKWLDENIFPGLGFKNFDLEAEQVAPGSEGVIFLPYLVGERTPHMDPNARGMFFGLTLKHTRAHMIRAVLEGVVFSLRESLDIMAENGIRIDKVIASGGGAKSPLWKQIQADVFNTPIYTTTVAEQACTGAIITAGVAAEVFTSPKQAAELLVDFAPEVVQPIAANTAIYQRNFETYKQLYRANKHLFQA